MCWSGLLTNVWDEDTTAIMQKLLSERQKPAAMREPPFRRAVFLNVVMDPQENLNPWWILFGYVPKLPPLFWICCMTLRRELLPRMRRIPILMLIRRAALLWLLTRIQRSAILLLDIWARLLTRGS